RRQNQAKQISWSSHISQALVQRNERVEICADFAEHQGDTENKTCFVFSTRSRGALSFRLFSLGEQRK
ncbi:MAG: hypothetical protein PVH46_11000, partial [Granulosicoccaceae bacterium]